MGFFHKALYSLRTGLLYAGAPLLAGWYYRYRFVLNPLRDHLPEMDPLPTEGYSDKLYYQVGETAVFFIKASGVTNTLLLERITGPFTFEEVGEYPVIPNEQPLKPSPSETTSNGCSWQPTLRVATAGFAPGYYRATLHQEGSPSSSITFLLGAATGAKVAVLAPVTTWVAYNLYGGQSMYYNRHGDQLIYKVSTQRPNPALQYQPQDAIHNIPVEANIYTWLAQQPHGADLYPDYILEQQPDLLQNYDVLVLAYHAEYFSDTMYRNLSRLVHQHQKSLISLGGNQVYWQVKWRENFTQLECRKDLTCFDGTWEPGGTWRHTFARAEDRLLGVRFTEAGAGTFAPYEVLEPSHYLFKGTGVAAGNTFGASGITPEGICGDETDKTTYFSRQEVTALARGLNPAQSGAPAGSGGGELVLKELSGGNAVLSTGSIQSGSGLGADAVFTRLIQNFLERYVA